MKKDFRSLGTSTAIFASVVVVLVIVAGIGYGLYETTNHSQMTETSTAMTETMTSTQTMTETMTTSEMTYQTSAYEFTAAGGGMINNAWLLVAPLGMDEYAVSVHAEGLEANGTYVLEGILTTGSMQTVPISFESTMMNETSASEFQSNANGTGLYWIQLSSNPVTTFENVQLYYVPDMMMQNATLLASASFTMNETSSMTSSSSM